MKISVLILEDDPVDQIVQLIAWKRDIEKMNALALDDGDPVALNFDFRTDAISAFETTDVLSYDLIITDINMPVMDGHEFCRLLRDRGYVKPLVVLSSVIIIEEIKKLERLYKIDRYFMKRQLENSELLKYIISEHKVGSRAIYLTSNIDV